MTGMDLVTENNRWLIYCGKALALEFSAIPPADPPDPHHSIVVAVTYFFNVPYGGNNPPLIQERTT